MQDSELFSSFGDIFIGFDRLYYKQPSGSVRKIPSATFLRELILLPEEDAPDPFNVVPYRIKSQVIERESLLTLQKTSNHVVAQIRARDNHPTDSDKYFKELCHENKIPYIQFRLYHDFIEYVSALLPGVNLDAEFASTLSVAFSEISSKKITSDWSGYLKKYYPSLSKTLGKKRL